MLSISQRVVKILTHYKLNNAQLAQKLNVSPPVVTHLKSGRNKPSFDMLVQLSNSFPDMASALGKVGANTVLLSLRNLYKAEIIEPLDRAPLLLR